MSTELRSEVAFVGERSADPGARRSSFRMPILMYHSLDSSGSVISVAPGTFADHMDCLSSLGLKGIALREAVAHRSAFGSWPSGCVVLTFDDGYTNFLDVAMQILHAAGFAATMFLVSGHAGGRNDWAPPPPGLGVQPILSWQQVRDLTGRGIEIGAHTRSHPDLRRLADPAAENEIAGCRCELEDRIGAAVESFAYPFGHVGSVSQAIVRREFRAACTTVLRRAGNDDLHALPRIDMYYLGSGDRLARLLNGDLDGYLSLRRWGRSARRVVSG